MFTLTTYRSGDKLSLIGVDTFETKNECLAVLRSKPRASGKGITKYRDSKGTHYVVVVKSN